ncbi:STAS domain-containing protein [Streptomyces sp. NPDC096068]|uniref:STAS domain-containing protein n=1 Tax=Streptomyces sp. NPDC096068 TaxID=3155424 RepID=UPI0033238085
MNGFPSTEFILDVVRESVSLYVRVSGDLDYDSCDELVDAVTENLRGGGAPPRGVRLDFDGLTHIDSSGLSALLLVHRRASALGAVLYLENRPDFLERLLHITNVLDHLTGPATGRGPDGGADLSWPGRGPY